MSSPDDLDVDHIKLLASEALSWRPVSCTEHGTEVSVRIAEPADLQQAETALRRYGYTTARAPERVSAETPIPYLRVTGWSPESLNTRHQALVTTIEALLAGFESTVERTIDTYRSLRADGDAPQTARRKTHRHAQPALDDATGHAVSPLTGRAVTPPAPAKPAETSGIGWQISVNHLIDTRIGYLLDRHDQLAGKALDWAAGHESGLAAPGTTKRALEALQPWITEQRRHYVWWRAQGDLYYRAYAWAQQHTDAANLPFAWWYSENHDPNDPPEPGEAYRQWAATERPGNHGTRFAGSAASLAATDIPEPVTGRRPPPAPTESVIEPTAPTPPLVEPPTLGRSPHRGGS